MRHKARLLALLIPYFSGISYSYSIGLKSRDNSIRNIQRTEEKAQISSPLVSFIFDPRDTTAYQTVADLPYTLGKQRIYHITLSPGRSTAKEVAAWVADAQYIEFFTLIKNLWIRVVFRTMHEMNGGRYPWSSDPEYFKQAWQHVWQLSRDVWLSRENILFDMSVNGRDIPTKDSTPSQNSPLMYCYPAQKIKLRCPTFEDYYPGDEYVDIMWFTFYNRWKWHANRLRQTPYEIIMHPQRKTLDRIKKFGKPLFIDEVGTTSVRYDDHYDPIISQARFGKSSSIKRKNIRLWQLENLLSEENQIIGAIYFNVDLTYGLSNRQVWEADRSIFDPSTNMMYTWWKSLFDHAEHNTTVGSPLLDAFGLYRSFRWSGGILVSKRHGKPAFALLQSLKITPQTPIKDRKIILDTYAQTLLKANIKPVTRKKYSRILQEAKLISEPPYYK